MRPTLNRLQALPDASSTSRPSAASLSSPSVDSHGAAQKNASVPSVNQALPKERSVRFAKPDAPANVTKKKNGAAGKGISRRHAGNKDLSLEDEMDLDRDSGEDDPSGEYIDNEEQGPAGSKRAPDGRLLRTRSASRDSTSGSGNLATSATAAASFRSRPAAAKKISAAQAAKATTSGSSNKKRPRGTKAVDDDEAEMTDEGTDARLGAGGQDQTSLDDTANDGGLDGEEENDQEEEVEMDDQLQPLYKIDASHAKQPRVSTIT